MPTVHKTIDEFITAVSKEGGSTNVQISPIGAAFGTRYLSLWESTYARRNPNAQISAQSKDKHEFHSVEIDFSTPQIRKDIVEKMIQGGIRFNDSEVERPLPEVRHKIKMPDDGTPIA